MNGRKLRPLPQPTRRHRRWSPWHLVILSSSLLLLAGCASDNHRGGDPLLGGAVPIAATGVAPANPGAPASPTVPPAVPMATTTGSTAALAAGAGAGPGPSRSGLRIGDATASANVPVTPPLRAPEPTARLTGAVGPTSQRLASYEQAQVVLLGRGVKWQRLEMAGDAGEWKFSCALPDKRNANINRAYEGRGPNYLAAIQAVLDQMEREGR